MRVSMSVLSLVISMEIQLLRHARLAVLMWVESEDSLIQLRGAASMCVQSIRAIMLICLREGVRKVALVDDIGTTVLRHVCLRAQPTQIPTAILTSIASGHVMHQTMLQTVLIDCASQTAPPTAPMPTTLPEDVSQPAQLSHLCMLIQEQ